MNVLETSLPGVKIIQPARHADFRGAFMEIFQKARYAEAGITEDFVQDNFAVNDKKGTIRGLHFQRPPAAQTKLVYAVWGAVLDVVVDIRHGSPTFGQSETFHLTATDGNQILVPVGFAHGYCTLEDNTAVMYKVSAPYAPDSEAGIVWNDPELAISWPVSDKAAILAERDKGYPRLGELEKIFTYE